MASSGKSATAASNGRWAPCPSMSARSCSRRMSLAAISSLGLLYLVARGRAGVRVGLPHAGSLRPTCDVGLSASLWLQAVHIRCDLPSNNRGALLGRPCHGNSPWIVSRLGLAGRNPSPAGQLLHHYGRRVGPAAPWG